MPLTYAIRTSRTQRTGYEVYRVADDTVLATVATYGQASRCLDTLPAEDAERRARVLAWYRERYGPTAEPSPELLAILLWIDEHFEQQEHAACA